MFELSVEKLSYAIANRDPLVALFFIFTQSAHHVIIIALKDPKSFACNRVVMFYGQLALLAFAGGLVAELLGKPVWFSAGSQVGLNRVVLATFLLITVVAFATLELWRYSCDWRLEMLSFAGEMVLELLGKPIQDPYK